MENNNVKPKCSDLRKKYGHAIDSKNIELCKYTNCTENNPRTKYRRLPI